jgi:hypothetical protein
MATAATSGMQDSPLHVYTGESSLYSHFWFMTLQPCKYNKSRLFKSHLSELKLQLYSPLVEGFNFAPL